MQYLESIHQLSYGLIHHTKQGFVTLLPFTVEVIRKGTLCFPVCCLKSWSNLLPKNSFGICLSSGFQNTPYMLNLMKFWLIYLKLKTTDTIKKFNFFYFFGIKFSYRKSSLVFNLEYLCQFFIKFNNQRQFRNPYNEKISKLSEKFYVKMFKVKDKA